MYQQKHLIRKKLNSFMVICNKGGKKNLCTGKWASYAKTHIHTYIRMKVIGINVRITEE